ncbi:MAG TPA: hypothetical protein VKF37_13485 [Chloroflexota bacterium]|nr:hypothetical protein [Chloroflexota bacterium]
MLKRAFLVSTLVALAASGSTAVSLAAGRHGGGFGFGAAPEAIIPASADLYVGLNLEGAQGAALSQLWAAYQTHPGTAAALAHLQTALGRTSLLPASRLLSSFGARVGIAIWTPGATGPAAQPGATGPAAQLRAGPTARLRAGPAAQPRVALVAPLRVSTFLSGTGPLAGLASFSPIASYLGTTVYRVTFRDGGTAYGEIVAGDGVLTTDLDTAERVVDAATFHLPALATSAGFVTATAQLPQPRALTFYVTPHFFRRVAARGANGALPGQAPMVPGALQQPYAGAVVAAPDGLSIVSSVQHVSPGLLHLSPNAGASVVGSNALLYASVDDLAAMLASPGVLPANALTRLQVQSGIAVQRDILPLIRHEVVVDVNDEVSDVLLVAREASAGSSQTVPALPGSIELATWVDEPGAAEQSVARLVAAISRLVRQQGLGASAGPPVIKMTLPDGSTAYGIRALPGVSYTVRGHWLLLSTSLRADLSAARVPLAADAGYQAALARLAGAGPLVSVEYTNVTRLLTVVDAWLAFVKSRPSTGIAPGTFSTWRQQIKPLIAPLHSIVAVARRVGASGEQGRTFITIKP